MEPEKRDALKELVAAKIEVQNKLRALEQQIYDFEETFLKEATNFSNVVTGYTAPQPVNSIKYGEKMRFKKTDRLFSYSSVTSPNEGDDLSNDENVRKASTASVTTARAPTFLRPQVSAIRKKYKRGKKQ